LYDRQRIADNASSYAHRARRGDLGFKRDSSAVQM
jgi:hypothetical protein